MPPSSGSSYYRGSLFEVQGEGDRHGIDRFKQHFPFTQRSRTALEKAADIQESLAAARVDLLVEREKVSAFARLLQKQRDHTRDTEATFMNVLRKFYHENNLIVPEEVTAAYTAVQEGHDRLGSLEDDHSTIEKKLGGSEWKFMERENEFYGFELHDLLSALAPSNDDNSPAPVASSSTWPALDINPVVEYQAALSEFERLKEQFDALRPKQVRRRPLSISDTSVPDTDTKSPPTPSFEEMYTDLIMQISQWEVRVEHLREDTMQPEQLLTLKYRRSSDTHDYEDWSAPRVNPASKTYSEGDFPLHLDNPPAKHRIRDWLLDCLKKNAIERTQYLNILAQKYEDNGVPSGHTDTWIATATEYWPLDMSEEPPSPSGAPRTTTTSYNVPTFDAHAYFGSWIDSGSFGHIDDPDISSSAVDDGQDPLFGLTLDDAFVLTGLGTVPPRQPKLQTPSIALPALEMPSVDVHEPVEQNLVSNADHLENERPRGYTVDLQSNGSASLEPPQAVARVDSCQASDVSTNDVPGNENSLNLNSRPTMNQNGYRMLSSEERWTNNADVYDRSRLLLRTETEVESKNSSRNLERITGQHVYPANLEDARIQMQRLDFGNNDNPEYSEMHECAVRRPDRPSHLQVDEAASKNTRCDDERTGRWRRSMGQLSCPFVLDHNRSKSVPVFPSSGLDSESDASRQGMNDMFDTLRYL